MANFNEVEEVLIVDALSYLMYDEENEDKSSIVMNMITECDDNGLPTEIGRQFLIIKNAELDYSVYDIQNPLSTRDRTSECIFEGGLADLVKCLVEINASFLVFVAQYAEKFSSDLLDDENPTLTFPEDLISEDLEEPINKNETNGKFLS